MNKQELDSLFIEHYQTLLIRAKALSKDNAKAQDLVQTTYEKAVKACGSFDGTNIIGWLITILSNTFTDGIRREQKQHFSRIEDLIEQGVSLESALESAVSGRRGRLLRLFAWSAIMFWIFISRICSPTKWTPPSRLSTP